MDRETVQDKFLRLGGSGKRDASSSEESAGGFGVAKAVILGASSTFRWELRTRTLRLWCAGSGQAIEHDEVPFRQGTQITIYDVAQEFDHRYDYARDEYIDIMERLRELLGANDLPLLTLALNGQVVQPLFSRRGGSIIPTSGDWGPGTTARVKAYRRGGLGDRRGAFYLRLGGLFQFKTSGRRLPADIVVDLETTVRPGDKGYPLNAARDALQDDTRYAFTDLKEEIERENESAGDSRDYEVFSLGRDAGETEVDRQAEAALKDPAFLRILAGAAGAARAPRGARGQRPSDSAAPAGSRAHKTEPDPEPTLGELLGGQPEPVPHFAAAQIRTFLKAAETEAGAIETPQVAQALEQAEQGVPLDASQARAIEEAIDKAFSTALDAAGGGLLQAAAAPVAREALRVIAPVSARPATNPFAGLADVRISKKYDRGRARRFKARFESWLPYLVLWDASLRLIARAAGLRGRFRPGVILDDNVNGMAAKEQGDVAVIYVNPDALKAVVEGHKERPDLIAFWLHSLGCHELAHWDGHMGGHDEAFVAAREHLGRTTAHVIKALVQLVTKTLELRVPPSEEQKLIASLQRRIEALGSARRPQKSAALSGPEQEVLLRALHHTEGAEARWQARRVKGGTNKELRSWIGQEFGVFGGASGGEGLPAEQHWGGARPRIRLGDNVLGGEALVRAVRGLLQIPEPAPAATPAKEEPPAAPLLRKVHERLLQRPAAPGQRMLRHLMDQHPAFMLTRVQQGLVRRLMGEVLAPSISPGTPAAMERERARLAPLIQEAHGTTEALAALFVPGWHPEQVRGELVSLLVASGRTDDAAAWADFILRVVEADGPAERPATPVSAAAAQPEGAPA
jgi:hypothetical protein